MKSFSIVGRQAGFVGVVAALLLALVVPILASAAEVTSRSIALSNSSAGATDVSYTVEFTPTASLGAFVVDFCAESPALGAACTTPVGFTAASAAVESAGYTIGTGAAADANTVIVTRDTPGTGAVSVELSGITNPNAAATIYARIATYNTTALAADYVSTENNAADTDRLDTGSVAIAITDTIGVSGVVNESLSFCVSNAAIAANCAVTNGANPVLELGEGVGALKALSSSEVSTGDIYTQISTNAASGAVVNLKSNAAGCGGLINSSANAAGQCFIQPALGANFIGGEAKFGVRVASGADFSGNVSIGVFAATNGYSASDYALNFDEDELVGVTSVFGDQILNTAGAPASNKNATLTFGASVAPNTPAGKYSADLSLIATGKF